MTSGAATMQPGDVVAGRYRLEKPLGEGGFGIVYRASQLPLGRSVALKMLHMDGAASAEGRARFRLEAQMAQRLEHPNTVRLYDFGETEGGVLFIAWELLEGRPLDAVLAVEGRLPPSRVARITAQILKSLMEAHALGIVHRDIKPANLFLCDVPGARDFVKVLDFGLAKNTVTRGTRLTPAGFTLGTPTYMAPEQARAGPVSPLTDLYAVGLVMAELLSGRSVFSFEPMEALRAQLAPEPVPLPPEVLASPLGAVIARAVEKIPERRFASAGEMLAHLEPGAVVAPAVSRPPPTRSYPVTPASAAATLVRLDPAPPVSAPAPPRPPGLPPPRPQSSSLNLAVAAVVGGLLMAGVILAVVLIPRALSPAPGAKGVPGATGRHFYSITNRQIQERIERAGYRVVAKNEHEMTALWWLPGLANYVQVARFDDLKLAEATEVDMKSGITARDGTTILHVDLHDAVASRALLEQIIR